MEASGIILAALDCDLDAAADWNRWYDLEHIPPNVALDGILSGRRYVATPELHGLRSAVAGSGYADQRATFATIYTLAGDPRTAFEGMSALREELVAADRMFPDEKKVVREGGVFRLRWAVADPALKAEERDIPFLEHTGLMVVQHAASDELDDWYRTTFAPSAVGVAGVSGVLGYESLLRPDTALELVLLDDEPAAAVGRLRAAVQHHPDAQVAVEAPYALIDPLRYPWVAELQASSLPATVASPAGAAG